MEENWYAIEQQIRDRITEARTAARIQALTQTLASTARRPSSSGPRSLVWRAGSWLVECLGRQRLTFHREE